VSFQEYLTRFSVVLKTLKAVANLDLDYNSFQPFEKEVLQDIYDNFQQIRVFNGEDTVKSLKKRIALLDQDDADVEATVIEMQVEEIDEESEEEEENVFLVKGVDYPPSLKRLMFSLEAAMSHPSSALNHLKDLAADVEKVINKIELVEVSFCVGIDKS